MSWESVNAQRVKEASDFSQNYTKSTDAGTKNMLAALGMVQDVGGKMQDRFQRQRQFDAQLGAQREMQSAENKNKLDLEQLSLDKYKNLAREIAPDFDNWPTAKKTELINKLQWAGYTPNMEDINSRNAARFGNVDVYSRMDYEISNSLANNGSMSSFFQTGVGPDGKPRTQLSGEAVKDGKINEDFKNRLITALASSIENNGEIKGFMQYYGKNPRDQAKNYVEERYFGRGQPGLVSGGEGSTGGISWRTIAPALSEAVDKFNLSNGGGYKKDDSLSAAMFGLDQYKDKIKYANLSDRERTKVNSMQYDILDALDKGNTSGAMDLTKKLYLLEKDLLGL